MCLSLLGGKELSMRADLGERRDTIVSMLACVFAIRHISNREDASGRRCRSSDLCMRRGRAAVNARVKGCTPASHAKLPNEPNAIRTPERMQIQVPRAFAERARRAPGCAVIRADCALNPET